MAKRRYNAERRQEAAQQTRQRIIEAAATLFVSRGYVATTMAAIAEEAGVALDTVYAAAGTKPQLLRLLVEATIAAADRTDGDGDDVAAIAAEPDVGGKLAVYAAAIRRIQEHLAPLYRVLRSAAPLHPELGDLWAAFSQRRAGTMPILVEHLIRSGGLSAARDPAATADTLWMLTSAEVYDLLVAQRGWPPQRYQDWLADSARRFVIGA